MAIEFFPFDDGPGANSFEDRWMAMMRNVLGTGVLKGKLNSFEVYGDSSGMQVKVKTGHAWIEGHMVISDAEEILAIAANNSGNPRIDRIVLQMDRDANTIDLIVKQGVPAGAPAAPALTQTDALWEISLAQIAVANAAGTITAGNVTDERGYARSSDILSLTTAQRDTLPAAFKYEGLVIYNDTLNKHQYWTGAAWTDLVPAGSPPGVIAAFAGAAAPAGWLLCDGSVVSRATYADLFAVVGVVFNTGGEAGTDFRLPNLKGRVPVGLDAGQAEFDALGETGGEKTHVLTTAEMPAHTHNYPSFVSGNGVNSMGRSDNPTAGGAVSSSTGGGGAHNNLQPYLALNYIIKT